MKKFMMLLAVVAVSMTAMAQGDFVPRNKYHVVTNNFWANWYIQAGFNANAVYSSQEQTSLKGNPFSCVRGDLGFDVAVGKWFTPGLGLRTKFNGLWAKDVYAVGDHHADKFFNVQEDVMFNLTNLFGGYKEKRVWNISVYPGIGYIRNITDGEVNADYSLNVGVLNSFRIAKHWNIFLDVWGTFAEGSLLPNQEGAEHHWKVAGNTDSDNPAKLHARYWDKFVNATIGVTYNLGKCTWECAPDVDALMAMNQEQIDALNAALKDQQDENARLRDLLANQKPVKAEPVVQTVKELASTNASVFFNINKSDIASRKDLVNVQEIAKYAIDNNSKLIVTGYADSQTGTPEINQQLSEARANAVADELIKMGVKEENIEKVAAGGVDSLSPFSYNRRATVKIAE